MPQRIFRAVAVVVFILAFSVQAAQAQPLKRPAGAPVDVQPDRYESFLTSWMLSIQKQLPAFPGKRLDMGVDLSFAHPKLVRQIPLAVLYRAVDACKEAGAKRVSLTLPAVFPQGRDAALAGKYEALAKYVQAKGLKLDLGFAGPEPEDQPLAFEEFSEKRLAAIKEFAQVMKPARFALLAEPTSIAAKIKTPPVLDDYKTLVDKACAELAAASPETESALAFNHTEQDLARTLGAQECVKTVLFTMHSLAAFKMQAALGRELAALGKTVGVSRTWRQQVSIPPDQRPLPPESTLARGVGYKPFEELDVLWIETVSHQAAAAGFSSVTIAFVQPLFAYAPGGSALDPEYNQIAVNALGVGARTKAFAALRNAASRFGR